MISADLAKRLRTRTFLAFLLVVSGLIAVVHSGGFITPTEEIPDDDDALIEDPAPPAVFNHVDVNFEPARYAISGSGGRIRVTASTSVSAESAAIVPMPFGNLAIAEARLDAVHGIGDEADLLIRDNQVMIQVPAGRHTLSVVGALEISRTLGGRHAAWTPGLPGSVDVPPELRIEGAASSGAEYLVSGSPVKVIVGGRAGRSGVGSWSVSVDDTFAVSVGALNSEMQIEFEAFGMAPETFAIRLPSNLNVISVDGDAQSLDPEPGRVTLLPVADAGRVRIHAEGTIARDRLRLDALDVEGASRKQIAFRILPSPELFVEPTSRAGLVEEAQYFRVIAWPWHLEATITGADVAEGRNRGIEAAATTVSILDDGRCFGELDVDLAEPLPNFRIFLPDGAEILSAVSSGKAVAPVRSESGIVIPSLNATTATIVYRLKNPLPANGFRDLPLPRIEPAPRATTIELWTPASSVFFRADGPWRNLDARPSVLEMLDAISSLLAGTWRFLFKAILAILVLGAAGWCLLWIARWLRTSPRRWVGAAVLIGVLTVVIVTSVFLALGGPLRNMFAGAVGETTMARNQAALSAGVYGDEDRAKEELRAAEAPLASTQRRAGGYSIRMEIPKSGNLRRFESLEPFAAGPLRLITVHRIPWFILIAVIMAFCGTLFHRRPGQVPGSGQVPGPGLVPAAIVCFALADTLIPGAFIAALGGTASAAVVLIIRRLRKS
jgi:hypothetical protein